jgi:hypothetical protein
MRETVAPGAGSVPRPSVIHLFLEPRRRIQVDSRWQDISLGAASAAPKQSFTLMLEVDEDAAGGEEVPLCSSCNPCERKSYHAAQH